jgi:DNA-binding CsgD family transcriptional regulator
MTMPTQQSALAAIIGAIGEPDFEAVAASHVRDLIRFDLSAVILHRRDQLPMALFDDFNRVGCRRGMENYLRVTHRINPILARAPARGVLRARDFPIRPDCLGNGYDAHLVHAPEEELGFRTIGWPEKLEEVGLYFAACGGIIEFGLYRERAVHRASAELLRTLGDMEAPIAAAFDRHARSRPVSPGITALSRREGEVVDLLLKGCSSEAIALRLDISRHTVKDHRKAIFRKLGIASLAELFARHSSLH